MKRQSSRNDSPVVPGLSSADAQSAMAARRIFVLKQANRPSADDTESKTIQRILIFDDHPDSLRLILGDFADAPVDYASEESTRWWVPVLGWALVIGIAALTIVPLLLKLSW